MIKPYETKILQIGTTPLGGKPSGAKIPVRVDKTGVPTDPYWRRRLKDSKIDNCVNFIEVKKVKTPSKKEVKENDINS